MLPICRVASMHNGIRLTSISSRCRGFDWNNAIFVNGLLTHRSTQCRYFSITQNLSAWKDSGEDMKKKYPNFYRKYEQVVNGIFEQFSIQKIHKPEFQVVNGAGQILKPILN
jgi:hypothetical protein